MDQKVRIKVNKPNVPSGKVLLRDVTALTQGLSDALTRLVQRQLGYPVRTRLRDEAKQLSLIALSGVSHGSGVLECEPIPIPEITGCHPVLVSAIELVDNISSFNASGQWSPSFPAYVRNRIGAAVATVLEENSEIALEVNDGGHISECRIDSAVREALQEPELFSTDEAVEIIGEMFAIDISKKLFKVNTQPGQITVRVKDDDIPQIDDYRWKRVFVRGFPEDERCKTLREMTTIRLALVDEDDGVIVPQELRRGENSSAYRSAAEQAADLARLPNKWNSYGAKKPSGVIIEYALTFLRDAVSVLMDYSIETPVPFMVPAPHGGIQFEWEVGDRELELEFVAPGKFLYLQIGRNFEREGSASRWDAMRLVRWVATGERA